MTASRILSIAALAAFASFGAQAGGMTGDVYGANFEAEAQSTLSRAEVQAEAAQAVTQFKDFYVAPTVAAPTATARADVRNEAIAALRHGDLATGDRG